MKSKIFRFYIKVFLIKLIQFYTAFLKYIFVIEGCRYQPTCSRYMRDSIMYNGAIKGVAIGVRRILRCHPWIKADTPLYDPVKTQK